MEPNASPYPPLTSEGRRRMLAFLPSFEAGDFAEALSFYMKVGQDLPVIEHFVGEFYGSGFVLPFDWPHWEEGRSMRPEDVDAADLTTLRKLMTAFVRNDRFCGGALAGKCADGSITRILRRLWALSETA